MTSIIQRPGYRDRYDRARRQHAIAFQDLGRDGQGIYLQSDDLNEIQSRAADQVRRVGDYILQDGRITDGQTPVVQVVDDDNISVTLPACAIYIGGLVHDVDAATFTLPTTGDLTIGVRTAQTLVTDVELADLKGDVPGTEAYMEEGASRIEIVVTWGHSLDGNAQPLHSVFQVHNGTILTTSTNTDLSEIYKSLGQYSRESNGSFVNTGFATTALGPDGAGNQVFSVSEGVAYVNGTRVVRQQSMRLTVKEQPDLRNVDAEPHAFTEATGGTQTFTVSKSPISSISRITVEKEVTETVIHGPYSGAVDPLQHPSVTAILEITQGATTYAAGWLLSQGQIDWSPTGDEPAPGSSYTVKYRYNENIQADAVTRDTVTVSGAANGTNVLIDYAYKLPRIDAVCMDATGSLVYLTGVSAVSRPRAPVIPSTMIELSLVSNDWGQMPTVTASGLRNMPYSELLDLRSMVLDLYDLVAQERLKTDAKARAPGSSRGVFVDNFDDDDMRDQGIPQTGAVFGGKLTLPIRATVHEFPTFNGIRFLDFTDTSVIVQNRRSAAMKINPYATYTPMPGRASLEPSTDIWTDTTTAWTSPETQTFTAAEGEYISGISLSEQVQKIGETTVAAEYIRQRDVNFRLEGFIRTETLKTMTFDGITVVPSVISGPADDDGVITGTFTVPANVTTGSKTVYFEGSAGTKASCTYVGRGEITVEEYRLASSLQTSTATLPVPVVQNTVINNTTVVNNITNVNQANSDLSRGGGSNGGRADPLAQTFTLDRPRCIAGVRLMCAGVGEQSNSIFVQIRTVQTGMPTAITLAEAFVPGTDLQEGQPFTARFTYPVYLEAGQEYAFVTLTDDAAHALYIARVGEIDMDSGAIITEQPFTVGVLLSSSNASTWTVHNDADLWFELIGCAFDPVQKTIQIGTFRATKMSDVIVSAGVEIPDPSADVTLRLTRLATNEVITSAPSQTIRFTEYIQNEDVLVEAILSGTVDVTPFVFPDIQIVEGELQTTADYVTRAVDATDVNTVLTTFDALLPAGSTASVQIGVPGNYLDVAVSTATPIGDGVVEQTFMQSAYPAANLDARTRIVITGTPAARPEISALRMILSKV